MTVTDPLTDARIRSDMNRTISRWVKTLGGGQYTAAEAMAFARWRQAWYDEAEKVLGVKTLAAKQRSE